MTEALPATDELRTALQAARAAGELIARAYETFEIIPNARADISTEVDRAAQEAILLALQAVFPQDAYCAEEKTPALEGLARTGARLWIIDPIDGTRGFAMKNGEFSVMIAFALDGELRVGVVLEPIPARLTFATLGGGCWVETGAAPHRCTVTTTTDLATATLTQSHSKPGAPPTEPVRLLQPGRLLETYSAGVKLALVARGEADLYANTYPNFSDWDIAAGHLLVTEAGGVVTGLRGQALLYGRPGAAQRSGCLAGNAPLHAKAVAILRERGAS
jgi:3'(2'), 5'-bisphosphate nucleotidase